MTGSAGAHAAARQTPRHAAGRERSEAPTDTQAAGRDVAVADPAGSPLADPRGTMTVQPNGEIEMARGAAEALGLDPEAAMTLDRLAAEAGAAGATLAAQVGEFFTKGVPVSTVLETEAGRLIEVAVEPVGFCARVSLADQTDVIRRLRSAEVAVEEARADARHLRRALEAMDAIVWTISSEEQGAWVELTESEISIAAQRRMIAAADLAGPRRVAVEGGEEGGAGARTYSVEYLYDGAKKRGAYAREINPIVHTERLLNRLVHTMSETFAHLSVGLMIFDERGRLTLFNPSIVQIFEEKTEYLATRPQLGGLLDRWRRARKLPERLDYAEWRAEFLRAGELEETNREERWHMADGRTLMVLIRHHPSGGLAIVVEDITESITLRRSKASDRAVQAVITNHLNEGLVVIGPDGLVRATNNAFLRIWGFADAETATTGHVSKLAEAISAGEAAAAFWSDLRAASTNRAAGIAGERLVALADGRHLKSRISAMPDGSTLAVFTDVTASETIASALKERNEALERADEMRNALVDQISHRMRNPLNSIAGYAQMLAEGRLGAIDETQRPALEGIIEASGELADTIGEMSDLVSIGADAPGGEVEVFDPARTLTDVAELALTRVGGDPSRIYIGAPSQPADFTARRIRVRQIMFNLLIDALTKAPEGEVVRVGATVERGALRLEYRHAMTPDIASHGLALSLARRFVKLCRGEIEIETDDGVRLVRVTLPEAEEKPTATPSALAGEQAGAGWRPVPPGSPARWTRRAQYGKSARCEEARRPVADTFDRLHLADEAATAALGAALGAALRPGDAVLLNGPVGAGKTSLARAAIAARLDRAEEIPSPTFTIVQSYEADGRLWHADLYRLGDEDELIELGLEEAFDDGIVFVEWPEKLGALTPARRLELELSVAPAPGGARGEAGRAVAWRAVGGGWDRVEAVLRRFGAAAEACP